MPDLIDRALKAGAHAFVQKPWTNSELLGIISELLEEPASSMR
jgi:FixJ family two-component response regulator